MTGERPFLFELRADGIMLEPWTGADAWWQPDGEPGRFVKPLVIAPIVALGLLTFAVKWVGWVAADAIENRFAGAAVSARRSVDWAARTRPQGGHMTTVTQPALRHANEIRLARANLKHRVATQQTTVTQIIVDNPPEARNLTIIELLASQRGWGTRRSVTFCAQNRLPEHKTVGSFTERQRHAFAALEAA